MAALNPNDAVIVATARSPIGRAVKGSLRDAAPRRPGRDHRPGRAGQGARSSTRTTSTTSTSAAACPAASRASTWPAWSPSCSGSTTCPAPPSPATARRRCRPPGWRSTPSRPARATCSSRPASRRVSRFARGNSDGLPPEAQALVGGGWQNPRLRRRPTPGPSRARRRGAPVWTDPRDDGQLPDVYLAMGQTAENLAQVCDVTREEMDEFGVRSQNLAEKAIADGFWAREITPVTLPDGTVVSTDDGPRAGRDAGGGRRPQAGVPPGRPDHRRQLLPAQRRRRRRGHHERGQGRRARASPRWPGSSPPA